MSAPDRADVVVVGGGILGASAALHLVEAGVDGVILIERDGLAQGTSRAGAGFIGMWGAGYVAAWAGEDELEIEEYGLDFYAGLADDGLEFGYRQNGTLWIATTRESWDTHIAAIARHPRVTDRREIGSDEVEQLTGIVSAAATYRGLIHPRGGYVSAPKAVLAIGERLRERGGRVFTRRPAERIVVSRGRVTGVQTSSGRIDTDAAVIACGAWSNELLADLGLWMPMTPLVATRIVTEPLGLLPTMPTITVPEFSSLWLREESGALLWGIDYASHPHDVLVDAELPERFDGLPLDGVVETQAVATAAATALPVLSSFRSLTVTHGAPTFTADQRGLVGAVGGVDGLYIVAGCNEGGVSHGPGWGRLIADLVTKGRTTSTQVAAFSPDRFGDRFRRGREVLEAMGGSWGERAHGATEDRR